MTSPRPPAAIPVAQAPVAQVPFAQAPFAQAPFAQAPVVPARRRGVAAWLLACGGLAVGLPAAAAAGQPPFPLGIYIDNPNGSDSGAEQQFETRFDSFVSLLGAKPQFMNSFVDFHQDPSTWAGSAGWAAWSWAQSPVVGNTVVPVIGIPMSDNSHWYSWDWNGNDFANDEFYKWTVQGVYDADYQGIVHAWAQNGYRTLYLRLGYEMVGGFMPWFAGKDSTTQADWVASFRHIATILRAQAAADGIGVQIVWNPVDINYTDLPVYGEYPGDKYVDVISTDSFSKLYPLTLYDWVTGGTDATIQDWWAHPGNMTHFWTWPNAKDYIPQGTPGNGWGFDQTIRFARDHHKPMALSEAGAGPSGSDAGPNDNPFYPQWLAAGLRRAVAAGVPVLYVCIWDSWEGDGNWGFSMPADGKPLEAAAWAKYFGLPTPLPGGG